MKVLSVYLPQFLAPMQLGVPDKGEQLVRYYGIYSKDEILSQIETLGNRAAVYCRYQRLT